MRIYFSGGGGGGGGCGEPEDLIADVKPAHHADLP